MTTTDRAREEAERIMREARERIGLTVQEQTRYIEGFLAGAAWQAAQDPTDVEVEAAARALNLRGWTCFGGAHEPGEYDQCETCRSECRSLARTALTAARDARTGETR